MGVVLVSKHPKLARVPSPTMVKARKSRTIQRDRRINIVSGSERELTLPEN